VLKVTLLALFGGDVFKYLMFVGDPHGRDQHILRSIHLNSPEAVVLLGDLCFEEPVHHIFKAVDEKSRLHWIHGNHDTVHQHWFDNIFHSPWSGRNLHARVAPIATVRIAGLGGVFRGKIWNPTLPPRYQTRKAWQSIHSHKRFAQVYEASKRKHESSIWPEDYDCLAMLHADVLVLHEAPTSDRYGHKALDELASKLGVRLIIHGHHHRFYCDTLDNGIAVVGLGLAQIARLNVSAFKEAKTNEDIFAAFDFEPYTNRYEDLPL